MWQTRAKQASTTTSYSRFLDRQDHISQKMMQAAVALSAVLPVAVRGSPTARRRSATVAGGRRIVGAGVRASASAAPEADYSSSVSVFPMEACDLVGGEACDAQMFPETKLGTGAGGPAAAVARAPEVEREYLAYDEPKTVFPDEACDDLGGEFCEPPSQTSK